VKVLVIGSGAREHALAWKLSQSPKVDGIFAAPGNAGTARLGTNWSDLTPTSAPKIAAKARDEAIDLVVIGPEAALAAGVADALREAGINVFGPGRSGARLESSKAFAKQFMARHGIPTAKFKVVHDLKQAHRCLADWEGGVVVKADGLAAGKGVVVCADTAGALAVLEDWYGNQKVPGGGSSVVLEEALVGREVSVMTVTDGVRCAELATACDYKRAGDGDTGPNTGGMGAYSPTPDVVDAAMAARIREEVLAPTLSGLRADGIDYRGCLYAGIMVTARGPMVLEYNARFGDPETQVVLPRMESDLFELLYDVSTATVDREGRPLHADPSLHASSLRVEFSAQACVGVVLASEGYPVKSTPIANLPLPDAALADGAVAFWGGSTIAGDVVAASGGRILTICGLGADHARARESAYAACAAYGRNLPPGTKLCCRSDIGIRATVARH
jgi:phosphoribosylamine--glycine ligase